MNHPGLIARGATIVIALSFGACMSRSAEWSHEKDIESENHSPEIIKLFNDEGDPVGHLEVTTPEEIAKEGDSLATDSLAKDTIVQGFDIYGNKQMNFTFSVSEQGNADSVSIGLDLPGATPSQVNTVQLSMDEITKTAGSSLHSPAPDGTDVKILPPIVGDDELSEYHPGAPSHGEEVSTTQATGVGSDCNSCLLSATERWEFTLKTITNLSVDGLCGLGVYGMLQGLANVAWGVTILTGPVAWIAVAVVTAIVTMVCVVDMQPTVDRVVQQVLSSEALYKLVVQRCADSDKCTSGEHLKLLGG